MPHMVFRQHGNQILRGSYCGMCWLRLSVASDLPFRFRMSQDAGSADTLRYVCGKALLMLEGLVCHPGYLRCVSNQTEDGVTERMHTDDVCLWPLDSPHPPAPGPGVSDGARAFVHGAEGRVWWWHMFRWP